MANVDQLGLSFSMLAWGAGLPAIGVVAGFALSYIFDKLLPVDSTNPTLTTTNYPGVRFFLQMGLGVVALANLLSFLMPPDSISPIGDSPLYIMFYLVQVLPFSLGFVTVASAGAWNDLMNLFVELYIKFIGVNPPPENEGENSEQTCEGKEMNVASLMQGKRSVRNEKGWQ